MAVIDAYVTEASAQASESERSYTVKFRVFTNNRSDGPQEASSASIIPRRGDPYIYGADNDYGAIRSGITISLTNVRDSMKDWTIVCTFTSRPMRTHPDAFQVDDPVLLPPEIGGSFLMMQKPVTRDKDGNCVVNSALDFFEGLTVEDGLPTLTIAKNYATIDLAQLSDFCPSVNSTPFWGMGVRCWKLTAAPWKRLWKGSGVPYYQISYEFQLNWETWDLKPADRGWYKADNYQKVRVTDKDGVPLSVQEWLDGDGNSLDLSSQQYKYWDGVSLKDSGPVMEAFRVMRERNFALLKVPTSL